MGRLLAIVIILILLSAVFSDELTFFMWELKDLMRKVMQFIVIVLVIIIALILFIFG